MNLHDLITQFDLTNQTAIILLYAGPDQILPLVSIIGTIIGVLLIWWQRFVLLVKRARRFLISRTKSGKVQSSNVQPEQPPADLQG
jgi:hypothetical protein